MNQQNAFNNDTLPFRVDSDFIDLEYFLNVNSEFVSQIQTITSQKQWDQFEEQSLKAKQNLLLRPLLISFSTPLKLINIQASEFIEQILKGILSSPQASIAADKLQFGPLSLMAATFLESSLDSNQIKSILPNFAREMEHYFFEKGNDDDKNKLRVKLYNRIAIELIQSEGSIEDLNHLSNELNNGLQAFNASKVSPDIVKVLFELAHTKINDKLDYLEAYIQSAKLSEANANQVRNFFTKDGLTDVCLLANLIALHGLMNELNQILLVHPELESLILFTKESTALRHHYENLKIGEEIIQNNEEVSFNPTVFTIEDAISAGEYTILTNSTFGSFFIFLANVDNVFLDIIIQNQQELILTIKDVSVLIRLLNDCGPSIESAEVTIKLLTELKNSEELSEFVKNNTPREFFKFIHENYKKIAFKEFEESYNGYATMLEDYLFRFIKDSTEEEGEGDYNTILNAGLKGDETIEETWNIFEDSLRKASFEYIKRLKSLNQKLNILQEKSPIFSSVIGRFLTFIFELYRSSKGEFDAGIQEEFLKMMAQKNVDKDILRRVDLFIE